jgi:hypothetical protein
MVTGRRFAKSFDCDLGARFVYAARMASTPWGKADVVEEVSLKQTADDDREFCAVVQFLEDENGDGMIRFSYSTNEAVRRGPLTLRVVDLTRLKKALAKRPKLHHALNWACD